jgi:hypothetical protein
MMPEVYEVHLSNGDTFCLIAQGREQAAWVARELTDLRLRDTTAVINVRRKDEWT